jgi:hypothetical protein
LTKRDVHIPLERAQLFQLARLADVEEEHFPFFQERHHLV